MIHDLRMKILKENTQINTHFVQSEIFLKNPMKTVFEIFLMVNLLQTELKV